jgi:N-acetylglucosamine kinase-like BadF-type ATPase
MLLAVDAGGTRTRAVALDTSGNAYGYGRAGGGNPTSVGIENAVLAIGEAAALAGASLSGHADSVAVLAMAGVKSSRFRQLVTARLAALGWARVVLSHDLLGTFHSGTYLSDGYSLIAGTGTVAARVRGGRLDRVVGGKGWLLGDAGGGFWIGRRVARAVVAALDGQQQPTALTGLVLDAMGIACETEAPEDKARALAELVPALYARQPVQLAELAPLAFAVHDDPTARRILVAASAALADLVAAVRVPDLEGPVIGGGSVLVRGLLAAPPELRAALVPPAGDTDVVPVADGVVGACVLALSNVGVEVDERLFARVQAEVARVSDHSRLPHQDD